MNAFNTEFLELPWWVWLIIILCPVVISFVALWEQNRGKK